MSAHVVIQALGLMYVFLNCVFVGSSHVVRTHKVYNIGVCMIVLLACRHAEVYVCMNECMHVCLAYQCIELNAIVVQCRVPYCTVKYGAVLCCTVPSWIVLYCSVA